MVITGMAEYESVCKNALVQWYTSASSGTSSFEILCDLMS